MKFAFEQATRAVEDLRIKQEKGLATAQQVSSAVLAQAQAQKLYADALQDTVTVAEVHERTVARAASARQAESDLNIEAARTTLELAQARGDDNAVAAAQLRLTNEQVAAKQQAAQALRDEAAAMRATADAREREALATGTLSTAKKDEIAALRDAARLKELDAQKTDLLAQREAALAQATVSATDAIVAALERRVAAEERLNAVKERAAELERKRLRIDKEGYSTDKNGNRIAAGSDLTTLTGVFNFLKSAGVNDEAVAKRIAKEFADANGNIRYAASPGQQKYGGSTISAALLRAAERYTFSNAREQRSSGVKSPTGSVADQRAAAVEAMAAARAAASREAGPAAGATNVIIKIDGRRDRNVATDRPGAAVLQDVLQELADAKGRSS